MIRIVTHTRGNSPWIDQCVESVEAARVPDMCYEVSAMTDPSTHADMRWAALQSAEFVGFVDDDDLIMPEAIRACVQAIEKTGAGVAFTNQIAIDETGKQVGTYRAARFGMDIALDPQSLHHFTLVRREALGTEAINLALKAGVGVDWICKANAAMKMGAVHVPIVGYHWRRHPKQESVRTANQFMAAVPLIRQSLFGWMPSNFPVQVYHP